MQYMLMIYEDEQLYGSDRNGPAMHEVVARHRVFGTELGSRMVGGGGLKGTNAATTVRTTNGSHTIHDGPFAETKEQLGGYYLIDVPDLDAAIGVAKKLPLLRDGAVEIRPLMGAG